MTSLNGSLDYPTYTLALLHFFKHILSVPILPNRIPLTELPKLVSRIPWDDVPVVASSSNTEYSSRPATLNDLVSSVERSSFPHVLANLLAFLPPRYPKLQGAALESYLEIYTLLLDGLVNGQLEVPQVNTATSVGPSVVKQTAVDGDDSDDSDDNAMDVDVSRQSQVIESASKDVRTTTVLDSRTLSRLATLSTPAHLSSLLSATSRSTTSREQFFRHVLLDSYDFMWFMLIRGFIFHTFFHGKDSFSVSPLRFHTKGTISGRLSVLVQAVSIFCS